MTRSRFAPLLLLALAACGGDDADDTAETADTDSDTGADSEDSDASVDSSDSSDTEEEEPVFEAGTFQVRVMNLTPQAVTVTGTDADGAAVEIVVQPGIFSETTSLPVGTGVLTYDIPGTNQLDFSQLPELTRVVTVVGEVAGYTTLQGFREPVRDPATRTLMLATTYRPISITTDAGEVTIPTDDGITRYAYVAPNAQATTSWYTYTKPYFFTMARIPEGGIGFIVNSDISSQGFGKYYFATRSGPVTELGTDMPFYAYSADASMGSSLSFTATTPFGEVPIAQNVPLHPMGAALPSARLPADTISVKATDGTKSVQADFTREEGAEHAIVVAYQRGGQSELGFLQGDPAERSTTDAYLTLTNWTADNVAARCYHNFAGFSAPGEVQGPFLVAPQATLGSVASQACNLSIAAPPAEPSTTPTHDFSMTTSRLRGYHRGFVAEESGARYVHWAYRQTDDPAVYMGYAQVSPR
jgi:hypothetical protein